MSLQIWLINPIAAEEQAKQLLCRGDYAAFKDLAKEAARLHAPWARIAFAEVGYTFLSGETAP